MALLTREDREALAEGKLAQIKASLRLTAAQEKYWPAFEAMLREGVNARAARRAQVLQSRVQHRESKAPLDLASRLSDRVQGLRARADHLEKLGTTAKPLFDSLDEGQRRRLGLLFRKAAQRRSGRRRWLKHAARVRASQTARQ